MKHSYSPYFGIFILSSLFFNPLISAHGFSPSTPVLIDSMQCKSIHRIKPSTSSWILTYDFEQKRTRFSTVTKVGIAKTNCYFQIRLKSDNKTCNNEILCTPTQLFYVPTKDQWISAIDLEEGNELLGHNGNVEYIEDISFVEKPLKIHILEIKGTHNFFVGCWHCSVLTHNLMAPIGVWGRVSVSFGRGAEIGARAGSFLDL